MECWKHQWYYEVYEIILENVNVDITIEMNIYET